MTPRNELEEQEMRERLARLEERDGQRHFDLSEVKRKLDIVLADIDGLRKDWHGAKVLGKAAIGVMSLVGGIAGWAVGRFIP